MGAVTAGVAVAGGLLGLNQKQKEAKQQKQLLEKQDAAQRMQADLQLFSLLQQRQSDNLNNLLTESMQKQQYMQTQATLDAQALQQQLALTQSGLANEVNKAAGDAGTVQKQMAAETSRSEARLQTGAQAVQEFANASSEEQGVISSVLKQLQQTGSNQNSIALLLDYAASAGGVNEAMQMLSGGTGYEATEAAANVARASQLGDTRNELAKASAKAGMNLADVQYGIANAQAAIEKQGNDMNYRSSEANNAAVYETNQAGLSAARAANNANYSIMNSTNQLQQQSKYLSSIANESAIKQGSAINSEILALQSSNIRTPGFLDYVGVGLQGYTNFRSL